MRGSEKIDTGDGSHYARLPSLPTESEEARLRRTASIAFFTLGSLALVALLALAGCDSRAERIRGVDEALAAPVEERTPLSARIEAVGLRDGDCIDSTLPGDLSVESAVIVACTGTWQYRALSSFDVADADRYPGESYFRQRARESCDRRYSHILFPNDESWYLGHRTVNCLQDNFGLTVVDPAKLNRLVDFTSLRFGECFNEASEAGDAMVELVDCSGAWDLRVLNSFDLAETASYLGEHIFEERAEENCDRRYDRFRYPSREAWESGDRTITCLQKS